MYWLIYYGNQLPVTKLAHIELAIVDPDHINPRLFPTVTTQFIAYLSVGEADRQRPFWPRLVGKPFLIDQNPNWPDSFRVDVRSSEWQDLLLNELIPAMIAKGYKGLFLDTIDTASYLESKDPKKFAGSRAAMIHLIQRMHQRYPQLLILPNNGLDLLADVGGSVAGVVVEDLYTRYLFDKKQYGRTPAIETQEKEVLLMAFQKRWRKPVYVVLYDQTATSALAQSAIKACTAKGFNWYLTTVDLVALGTVMP